MPEAFHPLLSAIAHLYRSSAQVMLHHAATELDALKAFVPAPSAPINQPVCRHLDVAIAAAQTGPLNTIANAIDRLARTCTWTQNPNYIAHPPSPMFLDNYGYVEWVGPETNPGRVLNSTTIRVGVLMLGPATEYPEHHHPAEEVYHVLSGHALWSKDGAPWHRHSPGTAIHHPPHMQHATKTTDETLLALYCWSGAIGPAARLSTI